MVIVEVLRALTELLREVGGIISQLADLGVFLPWIVLGRCPGHDRSDRTSRPTE